MRLPGEPNRVDHRSSALDPVVGIQRRGVAKPFDRDPGAELPAAPQRESETEIGLPVVTGGASRRQAPVVAPVGEIDVGIEALEHRAPGTRHRDARNHAGADKARSADEAAGGPEIPVTGVALSRQTEVAAGSDQRRLPHGRPPHRHSLGVTRRAGAALDREQDASICRGDAIEARPIDPVGVHEAERVLPADVAAEPQRVEQGMIGAAVRSIAAVHARERGDRRRAHLSGELQRRNRIEQPARVDQRHRRVEQLQSIEEERPLLGEEQRGSGVELDLRHVRLDLREIGPGRARD